MRYRYTRYTGDPFGGVDIDELVSKLSRLLLSSGFDSPYGANDPYGDSSDMSVQSLHDAILDALLRDGLLSDSALDQLLGDPADADQAEGRSQLEELVQELIRQLANQGYITLESDADRPDGPGIGPGLGPDQNPGRVRFEVTDKSLDFLGYRALRDLLGSTGRSSVGRHDTREMATGVEAGGASKPYEFGDTLNIDASGTILNAVHRTAGARPATSAPATGRRSVIDVTYDDLMVSQGEYQSSCATVLMLDCSHSMILYGEDRFTPRQAGGAGVVAPDPEPVPGRRTERGAVPRLRRGDPREAARSRPGRPVLHEYAGGTAPLPPPARAAAEGHASDRDDH